MCSMCIKNKKISQSVRQKAKKDQEIGVAEKVFFPLPPTFAGNVGWQMDKVGLFFFAFCHGGREGLVSQKKIRHVWGPLAALGWKGKG